MKKSDIRVRPETYAEDNSVHVNTVYGWMRDGVIPHLKINRLILIDVEEADEALQRFKRESRSAKPVAV